MLTQPQHLYPLKIALRAQKLIQGSVFYGAFTDLAAGQYVRLVSNPTGEIKHLMLEAGLSDKSYETSWECFVEYMNEFQHPIYQHGVYSMVSHWDWYISKLGGFVDYARKHALINKHEEPSLLKLNRKPFREQINILKSTVETEFSFENESMYLIEEMNLVRNLGMHNEWEVDEDYLKKTSAKNWIVGQKRVFDIVEINKWHSALLDIIAVTADTIATQYAQVPQYG